MSGVSIVIKCFNEEQKIDAAIRSALRARSEVESAPFEVVVADGLSTDRTLEHAVRWARSEPVRVVQLSSPQNRNCGAGVQLGFLASRGDRLLFMDGDMVLQRGFLRRAMQFLDHNPRCAGVAGVLVDESIRNATDRIRLRQGLNRSVGPQPWLNGGGLYRRDALISAGGHAADVRLAAFEEADLGLRLERAGWQLHRLEIPAMRHQGHVAPAWKVLMARWRGGRFQAAGVLLKLHGFKRNGWRAWRMLAHPLLLALLLVVVGVGGVVALRGQSLAPLQWLSASFGVLGMLAFAHLGIKRDLRHVLTAWMDWYLLMLGISMGIWRPLADRPPTIGYRVLADGTGLVAVEKGSDGLEGMVWPQEGLCP